MRTPNTPITDQVFQGIYSDKKLRNAVAHAHGGGEGKWIALYYPHRYLVSEEQIRLAKEEIAKSKVKTIKKNQGKLILIGMGMVADGNVGSHRVRGYFVNRAGQKCFVEFSYWHSGGFIDNEDLIVDHAEINETRTSHEGVKKGWKYTLKDILEIVNLNFGCEFKKVYIDNYDLGPNDVISMAA